jgi:hypothetical protein
MFDWFVRKKRSKQGREPLEAGEAPASIPPAAPGAGLVSPDVRALVEAAALQAQQEERRAAELPGAGRSHAAPDLHKRPAGPAAGGRP